MPKNPTPQPTTSELKESLGRLEQRLEEFFQPGKNAHIAGANECNRVKIVTIPITLQTSDESKTVRADVPLYELEHKAPHLLHNFLEICRSTTEPADGITIESVVVQVNYKLPENPEQETK